MPRRRKATQLAKTQPVAASEQRAAYRWGWAIAAGIIIVAAGLAYSNTFGVPFLFDDSPSIVENPTIRHLWPPWCALSPPHSGAPVDGRPLVNLSLAVNYALGGFTVWGYHAVNLSIHILAALTLFGVIRRTLLWPKMPEGFATNATWLAGSAALVWAIHPLQTESVTYVSQRTELLVSLFYLLTLSCAIRGAGSRHPGPWYAASVAACGLGMASKEVMVSGPLVVLLYDRTFLAGSFVAALRRRWPLYLGLAATWVLLAVLVIGSGGRNGTAGFGLPIGPWEYALTQCGAIVQYLRLSFWPLGLCMDYGESVVEDVGAVLPQAVVVMALVLFTLWALWRRPVAGFLGAFFLAVLAPTSSVVPVVTQTVAEHRMYLALAAVVTAAVMGGYWLVRRLAAGETASRAIGLTMVGLAVAALGWATFERNKDYRDDASIWADVVKKRPASARAHNNLGIALKNRGDVDEAIVHLRRALELKADYPDAHVNLGVALRYRGAIDEAIAHNRRALELKPDKLEAHINLGFLLTLRGEFGAAKAHCRRALELDPDNADAHNNLGMALANSGDIEAAMVHFRRALELQPDQADAHNNLGVALVNRGEVDAGIAHLRRALEIDPRHAGAAENLRRVLARPKAVPNRASQTLSELRAALAAQPNDLVLLNNAAWILATSEDGAARNGSEAVDLAERATALTERNDPAILDTLAAAYAESGRFTDAARTAEEAAELATRQNNPTLAASLEVRMRLYQQGKSPFPKGTGE
jgi:protein O-mannosyl-transferase